MATPALAVPPEVVAARKQVESSDFFALCYLMLCQLAYTDEGSGQGAVDQITRDLPQMPAPQSGAVPGAWRLAWGPAVSGDNSNLMYAAEFVDRNSGLPVFSAVAIRGTDTEAKPSGVLRQIVEDLDADHQVVFPENNTVGSKIAKGTSVGLNVLTGFQAGNPKQTVEQYLAGFVAKNPGAPIVVTGHSLGGCQTTVVAMYLAGKLPQGTMIVPNSFAAPTAGNAAFIQLYERTFARCPRWFNTLDLVPRAFAGLDGIKELWTVCQRPAPLVVKFLAEGLKLILEIAGTEYRQESAGQSRPCVNGCQQNGPDPVSKLKQNEAAKEIQQLIHDLLQKLQAAGRFGQVVQRLEGDLSKFNIAGMAAHLLPHGRIFEWIIEHLSSIEDIVNWVRELLFQHSVLTGYWAVVEAAVGVAQIPIPPAFLETQAAATAGGK